MKSECSSAYSSQAKGKAENGNDPEIGTVCSCDHHRFTKQRQVLVEDGKGVW
ncbi:hypothetical protein S7335_4071 [Synechococcus sp. PCC 7335]|uniref:hypothetical protein n=1 Tax=Synechococcus sp. (strain ATCC 29403 / PCC 7335) TaxID=91464 RepID=UPI00017ECED2|nr:hypothetical protein [Synechococcus sp. PCC 7335]EDX86367.1 hypothetical protein S7335_4071 [Synechococcus sp. PCC 7335]